jgi:predicted nucleic acid-binding protein
MAVVDLTADVVELATEYRARHKLKTPDALHMATAVLHKADAFITGDVRLGRCPVIPVEVLTA